MFDFVAVVAQFGLLISEQVAKVHRFAVCSCDLRPFYSCCHALNKLDLLANECNYYVEALIKVLLKK